MKSLIGFFAVLTLTTSVFAEVAPEVLAKHRAIMGTECEADQEANAVSYDLAPDRKLVFIPCYFGAYQGSARAYITVGSGEATSISQVAILTMEGKTIVPTLDLGDGDYDPKTKTIFTSSRGRGIGDCGESTQSKVSVDQYNSIQVKTIKINYKEKCDGKMNAWPVVFTQK